MRVFKYIVIILSMILFAGCTGNKSPNQETSGASINSQIIIKKDAASASLEEEIINTVMALPECQAANAHIDSISNHQKGLASMMDPPEQGETDYSVRVGYNGDERFETYYFFYVNPSTFKVKILDIVSDSIVPIEYWRTKNPL